MLESHCPDCNRAFPWNRDAFRGPYCACPSSQVTTFATYGTVWDAMAEEQRAEYEDYVRRCGGVPISKVKP